MSSMDSNCWIEKRLYYYSVLRSSGAFPGSLLWVHALALTQVHILMKYTSRTSHHWSWMRTGVPAPRAWISSRLSLDVDFYGVDLWCRFLHVMYVFNAQKIQWMQSIGLWDKFCILLDYILSFHSPFQKQSLYHTHLSISMSANDLPLFFISFPLLHLLVILLKSSWDVTARDFVLSCRNLMNVSSLNSVCSALWTQFLDVPISLQAEDRKPASFGVPPLTHKLPFVSLNQ